GAAHADEPAPKSEKTAQILSGVGVGVSGALILAGFAFTDSVFPYNRPLMYAGLGTALVTPSLGEFYAGEYLTIGMAARAVGVGLAVYGLTHYTEDVLCQAEDTGKTGCKSLKAGAIPFLGLAAIAFVGGMAYDVSDAGEAVQRWNARHGFTITPTVVPTTTGPAPGISLVGQF
ncbi:MAG TPA: hypothetical protein VGC41_29835, partial [Kofleriaceae bacterium]